LKGRGSKIGKRGREKTKEKTSKFEPAWIYGYGAYGAAENSLRFGDNDALSGSRKEMKGKGKWGKKRILNEGKNLGGGRGCGDGERGECEKII